MRADAGRWCFERRGRWLLRGNDMAGVMGRKVISQNGMKAGPCHTGYERSTTSVRVQF